MKLYLALAALGLASACAESEETAAPAPEEPAAVAPAAAPASAPAAADEAVVVVEGIDTDFEAQATEQITEENFESELDALEAELDAEE